MKQMALKRNSWFSGNFKTTKTRFTLSANIVNYSDCVKSLHIRSPIRAALTKTKLTHIFYVEMKKKNKSGPDPMNPITNRLSYSPNCLLIFIVRLFESPTKAPGRLDRKSLGNERRRLRSFRYQCHWSTNGPLLCRTMCDSLTVGSICPARPYPCVLTWRVAK